MLHNAYWDLRRRHIEYPGQIEADIPSCYETEKAPLKILHCPSKGWLSCKVLFIQLWIQNFKIFLEMVYNDDDGVASYEALKDKAFIIGIQSE